MPFWDLLGEFFEIMGFLFGNFSNLGIQTPFLGIFANENGKLWGFGGNYGVFSK